jgi:Protein of unknown function (DUF3147)
MASDVEQDDDRIEVNPGGVRQMDRTQASIRFAAGAGASLAAALVAQFFGSRVAGPLLALPALLVASLTFIAGEDGRHAAIDDSRGAVLGALGLVAFAVVCWRLLGSLPTWLVLVAATAAWAATSLLFYALQRLVRRLREQP